MEKRRHERFKLNVEAEFAYQDQKGARILCRVTTKDISCQGIFLLTGISLEVGTQLKVDVYLPNYMLKDGPKQSVLSGTGQVVRTTELGMGIDFVKTFLKPADQVQ